MSRLLILGGTAEAVALARALSDWHDLDVITSLAGRTRSPAPPSGSLRIGGFGGPDGLATFLRNESIDAVIDATHPFAEQISENSLAAATATDIHRLQLVRPPWEKRQGDRWLEVSDAADAAKTLPGLASRVFLTSGHQNLEAFADLDDIWFLIRTIEPFGGRLPRHFSCLTARGPFDEAGEIALLKEHRIDALVTKASGGSSTYAKIAAARRLGLPVVMIRRPEPPPGALVSDIDAALVWIRQVVA
ncbi:MAG: cobalt-precorrin-6A reductase [Pseudomonadota bacterium]